MPHAKVNINAPFKTLSEISPETQQQVRLCERQVSHLWKGNSLMRGWHPCPCLSICQHRLRSLQEPQPRSLLPAPAGPEDMRVKPLMMLKGVAPETCCPSQLAPELTAPVVLLSRQLWTCCPRQEHFYSSSFFLRALALRPKAFVRQGTTVALLAPSLELKNLGILGLLEPLPFPPYLKSSTSYMLLKLNRTHFFRAIRCFVEVLSVSTS